MLTHLIKTILKVGEKSTRVVKMLPLSSMDGSGRFRIGYLVTHAGLEGASGSENLST